jgi:hypothetical protein
MRRNGGQLWGGDDWTGVSEEEEKEAKLHGPTVSGKLVTVTKMEIHTGG